MKSKNLLKEKWSKMILELGFLIFLTSFITILLQKVFIFSFGGKTVFILTQILLIGLCMMAVSVVLYFLKKIEDNYKYNRK